MVGTVTLSINGENLGTVDLIAGSTVTRNQVLYTLTKVGEFSPAAISGWWSS